MANTWTDPTAVIIITLVGGIPAWIVSQVMIAKYFGIVYVPLLTLAIYLYYDFVHLNTPAAETTKYVTFKVARAARLLGHGPRALLALATPGRAAADHKPLATRRVPRPRRTTSSRSDGARARCRCTC
eukprot:1998465-Prymnesium_polylepis.1